MSAVLDILNPANTISVNRPLAHALGLNVAVTYAALLSKHRYYVEHDMLSDGWFYYSCDEMEKDTSLSAKQQTSLIKKLMTVGLILYKIKGIPARRCFFVTNNIETLQKLVDEGDRRILKTRQGTGYVATKSDERGNSLQRKEHRAVMEKA